MDTSQWIQVSSTTNINNTTRPPQEVVERKTRPLNEQALNCPRCNSTNTKFCYYNNYSLTQPRYFCKACKRYWTQGGSLRNVPVGGGSRKNKKHSSSSNSNSSSSSSTKIINLHLNPNPIIIPPHPIIASSLAKPNQLVQGLDMNLNGAINSNSHFGDELSAMELLRSTSASAMYGGGFGFHDFSSTSSINGMQENGGKLFPFSDFKELSHVKSSNESDQQNIGQGGNTPMFWSTNANLGGSGGSW